MSAGMPILVCRDNKTGWYMSRVVPRKGKCAHAFQQVNNMLDKLGHKKYIIKTDQEPAMVELRNTIARSRGDQIIPEESPVMDSRSNGFVERAAQAVQDQVRTLRSVFAVRIRGDVGPDHPALS